MPQGAQESAISQNMAQRDHLTDRFITDKMTGGTTHGSNHRALLEGSLGEY